MDELGVRVTYDVSALERQTYDELVQLAHQMRARTGTLLTLDLVHDAWLKLAGRQFAGKAQFRVVVSHAMRQVLSDHARAKNRQKRNAVLVTLSDDQGVAEVPLVDLHLVLDELQALDARGYEVVVLRYLGGLTVEEVATHLGISERTVHNVWRVTRVWLMSRLQSPA